MNVNYFLQYTRALNYHQHLYPLFKPSVVSLHSVDVRSAVLTTRVCELQSQNIFHCICHWGYCRVRCGQSIGSSVSDAIVSVASCRGLQFGVAPLGDIGSMIKVVHNWRHKVVVDTPLGGVGWAPDRRILYLFTLLTNCWCVSGVVAEFWLIAAAVANATTANLPLPADRSPLRGNAARRVLYCKN